MDTFTIRDLTFSYPGQTAQALKGLNLSVRQGDFFVLCGASGCGKSTLLRQLKTVLAPRGQRTGEILFEGVPLDTLGVREQAARIGFVQQSPENQIVTDKVWHELAFGLESLGCDTLEIRRKTAEMAAFFGIQDWFHREVSTLSGGQKQLLNLAAVMVLQPAVLILDEPTSQLDPIAASDFLTALEKINRELGTTILLTEHRLEEALSMASAAAVLEQGRVLCTGTPAQVGAALRAAGNDMFLSMPTAMQIWASVENTAPCPVTVREGRGWLAEFAGVHPLRQLPAEATPCAGEKVLSFDAVWFRYEKENPDVVRGLTLQAERGTFTALLGGNGAGKTTALRLAAGLLQPSRGTVRTDGRIGFLPQNPQSLFIKKTVGEDLLEAFSDGGRLSDQQREKLLQTTALCRLNELLERHPYDLSGGEQQRAALAKVLLQEPEILLLDEPTKGMDAAFKVLLGDILQALQRRGVTILMVSHDIEFCASYAGRCALFFDGGIAAAGTPRVFFSGNRFYTTAANRMAREYIPGAVTAADVVYACGGRLPERTYQAQATAVFTPASAPEPQRGPLPRWRRVLAAVAGLTAAGAFVWSARNTELSALAAGDWGDGLSHAQWCAYAVFFTALLVLALAVGRRARRAEAPPQPVKRKLARRTAVTAVLVLLLVPLTLFVGLYYLESRRYYFIALLILLECMLPFFLVFEGRKPQARELVVIAVLCAIGVAGRAAFFMLPQFKPVMAIAIIAGVALGGETGFLVGAMTMLVSNMLFGQGIWTPWQMFAMGLVGFFAGILFQKGILCCTRGALCVFGVLAALLIYGGIVNPVSVLMWADTVSWELVLTYYISGFPMDCLQAAATAVFLWFAAEPMLEKLERMKTKYGLLA